MIPTRWTVWSRRIAAVFMLALLAACAQTPPAPSPPESPLDQAATELATTLLQQLKAAGADTRRGVVLDPMLEAGGGQQTHATRALGAAVASRLMKADATRLATLPFEPASLARARYLLTGTFTRLQVERTRQTFRLDAALTDLATATVAAQAASFVRDDTLDSTPLAYFRDSPVQIKDPVFDGYVRTSASAPGQKADPAYLDRVGVAPLIERAQSLYAQNKFEDALLEYRGALSTPAGEQLRVLSGVYLTNWRLGRRDEAEQAFGRIVALGIAYQQLGVKFLFKPGTTDFWTDPEVSGGYPMWLRQIAAESRRAAVCMNVVGHTSRTGSAPLNDALSMQRAVRMQQLLAERAAELGPRVKPDGMGFRQNLVGSGTDDALAALDRRVEFKIVPCS